MQSKTFLAVTKKIQTDSQNLNMSGCPDRQIEQFWRLQNTPRRWKSEKSVNGGKHLRWRVEKKMTKQMQKWP